MSSITTTPAQAQDADSPGASGGALSHAAPSLVAGAMLLIPFLALFHAWFLRQNRFSWGSPDWSHAYIIPFISGYVIWMRREQIRRIKPEVFWPGLLPALLGVACYFYFTIGYANHMFGGFSMVLTIFGLTLLLAGPRMIIPLAFPIAYLAFSVTIAEMVMLKVTADLQLMASWGSWVLLNIIGGALHITTDLAGNTLYITTSAGHVIPLNVAEACSGMRMLVAFYALGVAVAFLSCPYWWQRFALVLIAGPVAVLVNVLRVAFLGVASLWNKNLAAGQAHTLIGVLWLVPAFMLFMGIVWALNRMVHQSASTRDEKGDL